MASQQSRRARSSSDKAQGPPPVAPPQRPSLQNRTISAPAGDIYTLNRQRVPPNVEKTVIEENESHPPSPSGNAVKPGHIAKGNDEINLPHVNLAVVGARGVGKSTFIQCALDMKHPPLSRSCTKKMSLEGVVYVVRLLEISLQEITFDGSEHLVWPQSLDDQALPIIDGVIVLHDVTNPSSITECSRILNALAKSALPFVCVSCKCDLPHPSAIEQANQVFNGYELQKTSSDSPRTQKRCISIVLRSIIARTSGKHEIPAYAPSSEISSQPPVTQDWHYNQASSETPRSTPTETTTAIEAIASDRRVDGNGGYHRPHDKANDSNLAPNVPNSRYGRSNSHPVRPQTPPSGGRLNPRRPSVSGVADLSPSRDRSRQHRRHTAWRHSAGSDSFSTYLDMDDEGDEPRSTLSSPDINKEKTGENSSNETGFTFDELVDRLVSLPVSKQDSKFAAIFLCLYRKFAAPATLLNALISRFETTEKSPTAQLTRIADQLRLLNVVAQWVSEYPGDFAYPKTRKRLADFVASLEKSPVYMFAAKEIGSYLEVTVEDDDVGWPFRDGDNDESNNVETFLNSSPQNSPLMFLSQSSISEDPLYNISTLDLSEEIPDTSSRHSTTLSNASSAGRSGIAFNQSISTLMTVENAQREARTLEITPKHVLTKLQWRQFMEIPDEDFARELTRMDWIMYSSFRPRDLVRHVSISGDKDKIKSLEHVNRMIKSFNHLAFWVASMILLRDKPKHRAKALEKFMNIAQKLRRQNNYNSLGAVMAGINGTPVHRLAQTRELVPPHVQKEFMRLVILMGTQKSHFAYRLAWDNSFGERIPFLPLHRRDLVSAEEGNKTFVGDNKNRINWKKFEIMGEVVLGIQRSQRTPYPPLQKNEEVQRLILDTKLSNDEDDLYARSLQVEPSAAGGETGRRKFGWLRS
ncbi:ras guanyl-nucleotide exchange factor RasGEF [Thermoascus aurantiacus ATCC 26904]